MASKKRSHKIQSYPMGQKQRTNRMTWASSAIAFPRVEEPGAQHEVESEKKKRERKSKRNRTKGNRQRVLLLHPPPPLQTMERWRRKTKKEQRKARKSQFRHETPEVVDAVTRDRTNMKYASVVVAVVVSVAVDMTKTVAAVVGTRIEAAVAARTQAIAMPDPVHQPN